MQITSITGSNIHGRDFSYPLSPITVFTGKNRDGKTACLRTIRLGLLGYEPRLPKTNQGVFKLAGKHSRLMSVVLDTDTGQLSRSWEVDSKGSVAYKQVNNSSITIPPTLLDPTDFLRKSAADQVKYVFDLIDLAEFYNHERFIGRLTDAEVAPPAVTRPVVDAMVGEARSLWADCVKAEKGVQFFLNTLEKLWADRQKSQDTTAKGSSQKITALRAEVVPPDVAEKLKQVTNDYTLVSGELAQLHSQLQAFGKQRAKYDAAVAVVTAFVDKSENLDNLHQDVKEAAQAHKEAEARLHVLKSEREARERTLGELAMKLREVNAILQRVTQQRDKIADEKRCPTCNCKGEEWMSRVLSDFNLQIEGLQAQASTLDAQVTAAKAVLAAVLKKVGDEQVNVANVTRVLNDRQQWIATHEKSAADHQAAKLVVDTFTQSGLVVEPGKVEELESRKAFLADAIHGLKQADQARATYIANKTARLELEKVMLAAESNVTCCKAFLKILNQERAKMIEVAFAKILEPANEFITNVLPFSLQFLNGELGYESQDGWVGYETFSGAEEKIAMTGFCLALARISKFKIAVLDEIGVLDREHKTALFSHVDTLIKSGRLDQMVVVDIYSEDYEKLAADGVVSIIALERRAQEAA